MKDVTFSKWIIKASLIQGFLMMWASYGLALAGRTQIAESLSKTVCIEIVVMILGYYTKAGVENLSKYNNWPDKKGVRNDSTNEFECAVSEDFISPTFYTSDSDTSLSFETGNNR